MQPQPVPGRKSDQQGTEECINSLEPRTAESFALVERDSAWRCYLLSWAICWGLQEVVWSYSSERAGGLLLKCREESREILSRIWPQDSWFRVWLIQEGDIHICKDTVSRGQRVRNPKETGTALPLLWETVAVSGVFPVWDPPEAVYSHILL